MTLDAATEPARRAPEVPGGANGGGWLRRWWPLLALGAGAVAISLLSRYIVYPAFSWNRDEPVYLWQIHLLRDGHFTATDGGAPLFFQPWLSGFKDGAFFSQYTLGWPLVLFVADLFGTPAFGIAFGALLAVVGTYALAKELIGDRNLSLAAAGVMLASPIIPIQGGVYLGYLFTLGLGLLFATAMLAGLRQDRMWKLVVAGALLGWIFFTRPFDALLWGAAVVGYVVFVRRADWRTLFRPAAWFALGLLPLVAVTLAYNVFITGKVTQFPITAADPLDKYGFGKRRIAQKFVATDYTIGDAFRSTGKNGFYVPLFLTGTYLGVLVAAAGLWMRRRDTTSLLLVALMLVFPFGYFFFWGMHVSAINVRMSGPIYFVPLYAPLSILIAVVLVTLWRQRPRNALLLVLALVIATVPFEVNRIHLNQSISRAQRPWRHATDAIRGRAVVFVADSGPYLLFLDPFSENNSALSDRVLYAVDRGSDNFRLIERLRNRVAYREVASFRGDTLGPREDPNTPKIEIQRLRVLRGGVIQFHVQIKNARGRRVVASYLGLGRRANSRWRILDLHSRKGEVYDTVYNIAVPGSPAAGSPAVAALPQARGALLIGAGFGPTVGAAKHGRVENYYSFRAVGREVELLLPPRTSRMAFSDGVQRWVPAFDLPELHVEPRAVTSAP